MDDITLLQECVVKVEEEELMPVAALYMKTEVETDEGTELQDHLAVDPLADCEEWNEKNPLAESFLERVKEEEPAEAEPEADARISKMRSDHIAFEEMKDSAEYARGSTRRESPTKESASSTPQIGDVQTHTNWQPIVFMHSSDTFRHIKAHTEHVKEHPGDPQMLICDTCQRQFKYRKAFVRHCRAHVNEHEKKRTFPCGTCGKVFKYGSNLKSHLLIHTGEKPFVCDRCGKRFIEKSSLTVHCRQHTGERPYCCTICNKRFAVKGNLVEHTRRHLNIRPFECKECGKTFVGSNRYTTHLRVHTGERPFKCSLCSKTFARTECLKNHMFTHSRDRKQMSECEVCGDSFKTTYMINHMRTHTGEKPFKCRFCKAAFANSSNRRSHEEMHSDRKLIQCKECGKSLSSTHSLKLHMLCHTGTKQYKCDYCDKSFAWKQAHKKHLMMHTKEYPYNCAECGKGCPDKWKLAKHILTHGKQKVVSSTC